MTSFAPELLDCLTALVEEGSFERAARRLSITQSAVSQRLKTLEGLAGTVLIARDRPLRATPAGRLLFKHALQLRLLRTDLEHELQHLSPSASTGPREDEHAAIAVNADSIATWALPAFDEAVRAGLQLEIIADDQDFTQDWLREGQVLGCVTTLAKPLRGCKVLALGSMDYLAAASPAAISRLCPQGYAPRRLRDLPFVAFNRKDDLQAEFVCRALKLRQVALQQCFVPSPQGQMRALLAGWGASVLPELLVRPWLDSGQLVDLAPETRVPVALYWHCWNLDSPLLDRLTRAVIAAANAALHPPNAP